MSSTPIHSSIIALVSLSAGIASKHPDMGLCQLDKLRSMGISEDQIDTVVAIARTIRAEAEQKLDAAFDQAAAPGSVLEPNSVIEPSSVLEPNSVLEEVPIEASGQACCTSTASGQSCC